MIWILIVMASGSYSTGVTSSIEFNNQQACISARNEMIAQGWRNNAEFICVKKGETEQ